MTYVVLGNPRYPPLLTMAGRDQLTAAGVAADAVLAALLETDRAVLAGLTAPDTFRLGLEAIEDLLARVDPVVDERAEDDIAVATNGGFAQSAASPLMSENEQNAKLRLSACPTGRASVT